MATTASVRGTGEVSVRISGAAAAGGELQLRERTLNRFVRVIAFFEWAGNAFGALAFLWATGVLLGGFCSNLQQLDFWFAMLIIFIEAFRIFSRNYKSDNQWLFGTTRALTDMPFARMLGRPQEGNEMVLIMGLWIYLVSWLPVRGPVTPVFIGSIQVALFIVMSKMQLLRVASQRCQRLLQLWAFLIALIILYAFWCQATDNEEDFERYLIPYGPRAIYENQNSVPPFKLFFLSGEMLIMVGAALLLISRPPIISRLTSTPWGRSLLFLAKLISAVTLAFGSVMLLVRPYDAAYHAIGSSYIISLATTVLSLGSLQTPAAENCSLVVGCWIDATLHLLFFWYLVESIPMLGHFLWPIQITLTVYIAPIAAVLLTENLQIPAALLQVILSSVRFYYLHSDYPDSVSSNLEPAVELFYALAICQGCFYITASILGLFSFFPRRMFVRQSNLRGQQGAKAIDLYYESAYSTCMETGLFAARKIVSLDNFAMESLISSSSSDETRLAGVLILGNILHECRETDSSQELRTKIIRSKETLSTLICMLGWQDVRHHDARLTAARVIANVADRLTIIENPGLLKLLSSLLDAGNGLLADQETSVQIASSNGGTAGSQSTDEQLVGGHAQDKQGVCYWVHRCLQLMKDRWSILEELPLTHQDSLPMLGMVILEKLAHDPDNCVEIAKSPYLISKTIGLISYTTGSEISNDEQQNAVLCASLNFVRRLASTGENIGAALRQELCKNSFLVSNLEIVLEDSRSIPEVMTLVIDILTKLALDEDARKDIGSCKVTISKLIHAFIGKDGSTNAYYNQSLRMAAGEALANLTAESPENCLVILEETGYEIIKGLKNMLCEDDYKYVAASLLQNICVHAKDKLHHQDASNHLSSAFPMVMENIISAEGKHMEVLIGLVSQICDMLPESFIHDQLQLQTNKSDLVQKLVSALNSNRKPNPEYPRMRRVIVEMVMSIVKLCPRYATILREGGMMEALSKVEMTPSKVEKHKVFYGNIGVVLESGTSLTALVARAKELIRSAAPTPLNQTTMLD